MVCSHKDALGAPPYRRPIADVEAEDLDLGDSQRADEALAFDVDGDVDAEALESDDEAECNDELGIEAEETDGGFLTLFLIGSKH